jgi:hypothetical protein
VVIKNSPRVSLYFRFYGDSFDPDEFTRRLGIKPTHSFQPGDPITADGHGRRRESGWWIKVGPEKTLDIEEMLRELRERVSVSPEVVRQTCSDLNADLVIVCGVGAEDADTMPTMFFTTEFLEWVVELGASLNVDVIA